MRPPTGALLQHEYRQRVSLVIDYIHRNYGEDLNLDKLAQMACMSKFHFHRVFKSIAGEPLGDFVRRVRLKESVDMLMQSPHKSITEVALECGFSTSQNFTKMFKAGLGISPSLFRQEYSWRSWCKKMLSLKVKKQGENLSFWEIPLYNEFRDHYPLLSADAPDRRDVPEVRIIESSELRVAYIRSIGQDGIADSFRRLMEWAIPRDFLSLGMMVLTAIWSPPARTPADKMILDACISVPESVPADRWVNIQTLPGGLYAVYHCEAEPENHDPYWMNFIFNWLLTSIYQHDNRPAYEFYCRETLNHPQGVHVLDLCMPVKPLYD